MLTERLRDRELDLMDGIKVFEKPDGRSSFPIPTSR